MQQKLSYQSIKIYPFNIPLINPFTIASTNLEVVKNIIVEIVLENGLKGFGEGTILYPVTFEDQQTALNAAYKIKQHLKGADLRQWRLIAHELAELFPDYTAVRCAFETAILDLLTRHWQMPLYQFFGGSGTHLYTDITIPICTSAHAERLAKKYQLQGFTTIKTKIGLDTDQDLKRLLAIREGFPDCRLVLDANEGYTIEQTLCVLKMLKQQCIEVFLLEQPLQRDDSQGMQQLTRESGVRIVADESCRSPADALQIVKYQEAHVLNIKLAKCGVVAALEIAAIARASGLGLMMGEMVGSRLGTGFSVHFAAGLGGFENIDLDTPLLLAQDPVNGGYHSQAGHYMLDSNIYGQGGEPVFCNSFEPK